MTKQFLATVTADQARGDEPAITISTMGLDRESDEVVPEGGEFDAYKRSPVVQWGHDYSAIPIGTTTSLEVVPTRGIRARWRWLEGDVFAGRVRNAWEQGIIRAASIGFRPIESERNERGGRRYTRWELLEWSLVAVPANAEAVRTLKRLSLWNDDETTVRQAVEHLKRLKLWDDDEVVLRLGDDGDRVAASREDVKQALKDVLPGLVIDALREAMPRELARRGLPDARPSDPFTPRAHVGREELAAMLRGVLNGISADLPALVAHELRRSRGRID
jgi:HK97 family phage prohead protease